MNKTELLKLIEALGDTDDVMETLKSIEGLSQPFDITKATIDDYKSMIENNAEIKGYYKSSFDSAVGSAVTNHDKKFNEEKLPKIIEEELKKYSNKDKTPEQIKLEELEQKLASMEKEKTKAELSSKYQKILSEKGLPVDLTDYILGDGNEDNINANIEKFSTMFSTITDTKVNEKLMNNSYVPPKDGNKTVLSGVEQAFYSRNPELAQ